ncbi:MAG: polysaccharide biosynthesis tyrosine autokinase [Planctomycetales bacterium]|nr:polysaccharide biosynthesis tyrosine autokinase [Planctomycetales bacterium]
MSTLIESPNTNNQLSPSNNSDFDLMQMAGGGVDVWGIVARRKWLLILGLILGLGLGYIYLLQADPVYESTARVLIETKKPPVMGNFGEFGMDYASGGESKHPIIITSPKIVAQAFDNHGLKDLSIFKEDQTEVVSKMIRNLEVVSVEDGSDVFDIKFRSGHPDDCERVVTAILRQYQKFLQETYKDTSGEIKDLFYQAQEVHMKKLEALQEEYKKFQTDAPLFWRGNESVNLPAEHQAVHDAKLINLKQEMANLAAKIKTIQDEINAGGNLDAILLAAGETMTRNVSLQRDQLINTRVMPLILAREELVAQGFGPESPKILAVDRQLELLYEKYPELNSDDADAAEDAASSGDTTKLVQNYLESLKQRYAEIAEESKMLEGLFQNEEEAARALAVYEAQGESLQKDIERTQKAYDTTTAAIEQMIVLNDTKYDGFKYQDLSPPSIGEKVAPTIPKSLGLGGILGLVCGFGIAYLVDLSDKAFRTPDEVAKVMGLPVVGHIPLIDIESQKLLPGSTVTPVVCTVHRPRSPQAESYRAVRTSLYFAFKDKKHQVIQVTSPMPGDGKSTLATNLAVTIAQSGKSVLLMDADFRRPTLHKVMGLGSQEFGLAGIVQGTVDPEDAYCELPEIPNLKMLACGHRPVNPSELLSSEDFAKTLDMLRERFDFVIVDTPPVLAVSDPCAVAARVDGILLTFRIHKRARPLAVRAKETLANVGGNVIGVVVNGVDQEAGGYYSHYRYGYSGYRYAYNYKYGYGYGQYGSEQQETKAIQKYFEDDKKEVVHGKLEE